MNEFQIVRDIERPAEEVFAALVNFDRIPDWNPSVIEVRWTKGAPIQAGSTMVYVGKFLGRVFESDSEVTEFVPGTKYSSKSFQDRFTLKSRTRWRTWRAVLELRPISEVKVVVSSRSLNP
jgi:uncharacterized protein YndB with AHSA1/START domain